MYTGNKALADMLKGMTPEQIREYWKAEQARRRAAGEAHHTTLYAAVTGPQANVVVAKLSD